jgi:hypothetical protein
MSIYQYQYQYQWKGQTNLNADTAVLSPPFVNGAPAGDVAAAVASLVSPSAENPAAMTDRVSSPMTDMTAILALIWPWFMVTGWPIFGLVHQFYNALPVIATSSGDAHTIAR